ncbi:hypothetical protein Tco_0919472 [Tanacetum coccineum]
MVPFIQKLGYSGKYDMLSTIHTDQMHQPWRTFVAIINRCISGKSTGLDRLQRIKSSDLGVKPKRAKRSAKKSTTVLTASVVIRDTPNESMPKKKTPAKVVRGKGMDLLSDVALLEAAQLKKTLKKSKLETHKLHASGLDSGEDDRNDDDSDDVNQNEEDDDDNNAWMTRTSDSEKTDFNEKENPNLNQNDNEEEEYEEEYVRTPDSFDFTNDDEEYEELYKDVNIRLQAIEHEEEGKGDAEMTDVGRDDSTQEPTYEQVKDDEHVILKTVHDTQKTEVPLQSSSVSFDVANQFLNLDNVLPTDTRSRFYDNFKTAAGSIIPLIIPPITPLQQQSTPTPTPTPTTSTTLKRDREDKDKDEDPPAGTDQEDMVPVHLDGVSTKVAYDKYAMWGITHWGPKSQRFYGYASNKKSKNDVFSTKRIITVTHVKVMKWYDYGYLEEIEVRIEDQHSTSQEGDFPKDLNLRDYLKKCLFFFS